MEWETRLLKDFTSTTVSSIIELSLGSCNSIPDLLVFTLP